MTFFLTLIMLALCIWCYKTDVKFGALIFLFLTMGGVVTLFIEKLPKSWTETTPTSILISLVFLVAVPLVLLIFQKSKKTTPNNIEEQSKIKNEVISETDNFIDEEMNYNNGINYEDPFTNRSIENNHKGNPSQDKFKNRDYDNQLKEKFELVYREVSEELGKEATHDDLVRNLIENFSKKEIQNILPGIEKASELVGREVTNTDYLFNNKALFLSAKYHELISSFDDFDTSNLPAVLNNDVNFYQMGWAGATTLASVSLFEVVDKLNIEFELQYNVPALKRNGIEVNSLPPIHKKKTWTYSNSMAQSEIYNSVAKEIEYLCSI